MYTLNLDPDWPKCSTCDRLAFQRSLTRNSNSINLKKKASKKNKNPVSTRGSMHRVWCSYKVYSAVKLSVFLLFDKEFCQLLANLFVACLPNRKEVR